MKTHTEPEYIPTVQYTSNVILNRLIDDQLHNNESSTDQELVEYFVEAGATLEEAKAAVAKRDDIDRGDFWASFGVTVRVPR